MEKIKYVWTPDSYPAQAHESLGIGGYLSQWQETLHDRFPEVTAHLVWDRQRLDHLSRAIETVLREDSHVQNEMIPLYQRSLLNQLTGLGPLDDVLGDDQVTEIMVNGTEVFCEVEGRIEPRSLKFVDSEEVVHLAQRLAARAGRELNSEHPVCDAQLTDGSRIHCVLPPVAESPTITIRRAPRRVLELEDYLRIGAFTEDLWDILAERVRARHNIVVAGGAGSGKTSLLRLLTTAIMPNERLITIEDVRELNLMHPNVVSLEAHRQQTVHQLVKHSLRMRPDRIIVGEVRGAEALELLEAMSTGHPGSLGTVHSAGADMRTVYRMARMAMHSQAGIPYEALVEQILETVDVLIYTLRNPQGQRFVQSVQEINADGSIRSIWKHPSQYLGIPGDVGSVTL